MSYAVIGLGFGDEGKGATVDWLCRETGIMDVVRWSGGCQAAHNVVLPDGTHHTFSQFGSGTLAGARTILADGMMIEPYSLVREATALADLGVDNPMSKISFDLNCLITTPYHWIANRLREDARGAARHGSCGRGIGETRDWANKGMSIRVRDLVGTKDSLIQSLAEMEYHCRFEFPDAAIPDWAEVYENYVDFTSAMNVFDLDKRKLLDQGVIMEGSQGLLLDEKHGFAPHNTWSNLTLSEWPVGLETTTLGCIRSYATRHGAGPFPTETHPSNLDVRITEPHNKAGKYQGAWRVGSFDFTLFRYATNVLSASPSKVELVINHLDQVDSLFPVNDWVFDGSTLPAHPYGMRQRQLSIVSLTNTRFSSIFAVGEGPTHEDRQKL